MIGPIVRQRHTNGAGIPSGVEGLKEVGDRGLRLGILVKRSLPSDIPETPRDMVVDTPLGGLFVVGQRRREVRDYLL
jgi:hypothetical protein